MSGPTPGKSTRKRDFAIGIIVSLVVIAVLARLGGNLPLRLSNPVPRVPPPPPFIPPPAPPDPSTDPDPEEHKAPDLPTPTIPDNPQPQIKPEDFPQPVEPTPPPVPHLGPGPFVIPTHSFTKTTAFIDPKSLDQPLEPRSQPKPVFPPDLVKDGVSGSVRVRFVVDPSGTVRDVEILSSTNFGFEEPVREAVLQWKFKPPVKDGRPVSTRIEMPVNFNLNASD